MRNIIITEINTFMANYLLPEQMEKLNFILEQEFNTVVISKKIQNEKPIIENKDLFINNFLKSKELENCSVRTLKYYKYILNLILSTVNTDIRMLNTDDIRNILSNYQKKHNCSSLSMDNIRRVLSSFYNWLEEESIIIKSPLRRIHNIKKVIELKEGFNDDEVEQIKNIGNSNIRNKCIISLLLSSGMRVGELVTLNKDSINFYEKSCIVFGKGAKERKVYFNYETKLFLQQYLNSRVDNNPALFVTNRKYTNKQNPRRVSINTIESILRTIGVQLNIEVFPHRFRRTMATRAIDKGMPIEQVQHLLGHATIDTTLRYAKVQEKNVMLSYQKFIC